MTLAELLANPADFDSHEITVRGVLLWHVDEPTLFEDMSALDKFDFARSIQLEMHRGADFAELTRRQVIVSGHFGYDASFHGIGYKGVFVVDTISLDPTD
jgi:hypothetical protein